MCVHVAALEGPSWRDTPGVDSGVVAAALARTAAEYAPADGAAAEERPPDADGAGAAQPSDLGWGDGWSLPAAWPAVAGAPAPGLPEAFEADETLVELGPERALLGEALFHPGDAAGGAGLGAAAGLTACVEEAISEAVAAAPEWGPLMWQSIVLGGGLADLPGLGERLQRELRSAAPELQAVSVWRLRDAETAAWRGAAALALDGCVDRTSAGEWAGTAEAPAAPQATPAIAEHEARDPRMIMLRSVL